MHFRFTPTSASWLNLVERFFGKRTERQIRRLAVTSVDELLALITRYIDQRDKNPTPFVWTANVRQILTTVGKANKTLATLHSLRSQGTLHAGARGKRGRRHGA